MGLSDPVQHMLEMVVSMEQYKIVAVSDEDPQVGQMISRRYECPSYIDFRRMIMQNPTDVVIVGAPLHICAEHIRQAIQNKSHIIKMPPAGLTFEQCASFIQHARKEQVHYILALPSRFEPAALRLREVLSQSEPDFWHLITAICHVPQGEIPPNKRWLLDPQMAGGGVLMQNAYDLLDEMVLCFGLPQQIYTQLVSQAPDRQQRLSITEDNAMILMRFSETLVAQVAASRTLGPARRHLRIHGKNKFITLTRDGFSVCDNNGNELEAVQFAPEQFHGTQDLLLNLANAIISPQQTQIYPAPGCDLYTMAVIESAYLSARTGMPETPSRLLELTKTGAAVW